MLKRRRWLVGASLLSGTLKGLGGLAPLAFSSVSL